MFASKRPFSPCVGCGYCCLKAQCGVSFERYGVQILCPALGWDGKRYKCVLYESHKEDLAIGAGCSSSLNSWRQDIRFRTREDLEELWGGPIPEKLWKGTINQKGVLKGDY